MGNGWITKILGVFLFIFLFNGCSIKKNAVIKSNDHLLRGRIDTIHNLIPLLTIKNNLLENALNSLISDVENFEEYDLRIKPIIDLNIVHSNDSQKLIVSATNNFMRFDPEIVHQNIVPLAHGGFSYKGFQVVVLTRKVPQKINDFFELYSKYLKADSVKMKNISTFIFKTRKNVTIGYYDFWIFRKTFLIKNDSLIFLERDFNPFYKIYEGNLR